MWHWEETSHFTTLLHLVVSWGQTDRKLNNLEPPLKCVCGGGGGVTPRVCRNGVMHCVCPMGALRALIQDNTGTENQLEREKSRGSSAFSIVQFLVLVTEKD